MAFAAAFATGQGLGSVTRAAEMDRLLHAERLDGGRKRRHLMPIDGLPDGTLLTLSGQADLPYAVRGARLLPWTPSGYGRWSDRPAGVEVAVLTPPAIVMALAAGYRPQWHRSADSGD
jgi:hypothetical protein